MRYRLALIVSLAILAMYQFGCEETEVQEGTVISLVNTLSDNSLLNIGLSRDYFYDFNENFNLKFYRWNNYSLTTTVPVFTPEEDTLNFRNYKDFLLTVPPDDISLTSLYVVDLEDT